MTKYFLIKLAFLCFFFTTTINAQRTKISSSLTGGYTEGGFAAMASVDYKTNRYDYFQFNLQGSFINLDILDSEVPVNLYAFSAGYFYNLLRNNYRLYAISIGGGVTIGQETVNKGNANIDDKFLLNIETKNIVYGGFVGIDADVFLNRLVALNAKLYETYHINSEIGELSPYAGIGLKIILK